MCGVLPLSTRMPGKLHLAYVEVTTTGGLFGAGQTVRGHVYHHSELEGRVEAACTYRVRTSRGEASDEGYSLGSSLPGWWPRASPPMTGRLPDRPSASLRAWARW